VGSTGWGAIDKKYIRAGSGISAVFFLDPAIPKGTRPGYDVLPQKQPLKGVQDMTHEQWDL
jgi:hypothetical protein